MSELRLDLNPLRFDDLVELGRSLIHSLAPGWTDHNLHDPGMMILDLLAWIAEAQMYSLSRLRRDERQAYARLLGIEPKGPVPARGLIWPQASGGKTDPSMNWLPAKVIDRGTPVTGDGAIVPSFQTSIAIELTAAQLIRVGSNIDGIVHDWTVVNAREGALFRPFGDVAAANDALMLTLLVPPGAEPTGAAPVSIGFEIENPNAGLGSSETPLSPILVALLDANGRRAARIVNDGTEALLHSGAVLVDLGGAVPENGRIQLQIPRPARGFVRTPAVRYIGLNVFPVEQIRQIRDEGESDFGKNLPDQQYQLQDAGFLFPTKVYPLEVRVGGAAWSETQDLSKSQPHDTHYEFDTATATITFGNGVNGSVVPAGAGLQVSYLASDGKAGNLKPGTNWKLGTVAGAINKEAMAGGADPTSLDDLRRAARRTLLTARPSVTVVDVESAALSFADLGVTRAEELPPFDASPRPRGNRVMVAAGPVPGATDSSAFLETVGLRISHRLPLGQRVSVVGVRYVPLRVAAALVAAPGVSPSQLMQTILDALEKRLATVTESGTNQWPLGQGVSSTTVSGWLRGLDGVVKVTAVEFYSGSSTQSSTTVAPRPDELIAFDRLGSQITVTRRGARSDA